MSRINESYHKYDLEVVGGIKGAGAAAHFSWALAPEILVDWTCIKIQISTTHMHTHTHTHTHTQTRTHKYCFSVLLEHDGMYEFMSLYECMSRVIWLIHCQWYDSFIVSDMTHSLPVIWLIHCRWYDSLSRISHMTDVTVLSCLSHIWLSCHAWQRWLIDSHMTDVTVLSCLTESYHMGMGHVILRWHALLSHITWEWVMS